MGSLELYNLAVDIVNVVLGLLDGGPAVTLALPPVDVVPHLVHPPSLLCDLVADLAVRVYRNRLVDKLQPARLARPVLLVALLPEVPPFPVTAPPAGLLEITHFWKEERGWER